MKKYVATSKMYRDICTHNRSDASDIRCFGRVCGYYKKQKAENLDVFYLKIAGQDTVLEKGFT